MILIGGMVKDQILEVLLISILNMEVQAQEAQVHPMRGKALNK